MSLDSLVDDKSEALPGDKNTRYYFRKIYLEIKNFYKTNLSVKFKLLYESAAVLSDRLLTVFGIDYRGGQEANPIMTKLFNYIGMIPTAIGSYLAANIFFYVFSKKLHSKVGLQNREMLGGIYLGLAGAESLVSLHNYLTINNYNDIIANMSYTQVLLPVSLIVAAPFLYYFSKNYLRNKREENTVN